MAKANALAAARNPALEVMKIHAKPSHLSRRRPLRGFTLLEMVIVLSIIAMIMGGAIFAMRGIFAGAQPGQAKADISTYLSALQLYKINKGQYPSTQQGLQALLETGVTKIVKDPWGRDYIYRFPGKTNSSEPEILSTGKDGQEGTDDDIRSQDL